MSFHEASVRRAVSDKTGDRCVARAVITERLGMLACDHLFNAVLYVHCFSKGVAPPSPIHTEPVIPLDAGLQFKLEFSQWRPAVGFCGAFDFLENVQLGHRHPFLGCRTRFAGGTETTPI
jgi:hypothetical protein